MRAGWLVASTNPGHGSFQAQDQCGGQRAGISLVKPSLNKVKSVKPVNTARLIATRKFRRGERGATIPAAPFAARLALASGPTIAGAMPPPPPGSSAGRRIVRDPAAAVCAALALSGGRPSPAQRRCRRCWKLGGASAARGSRRRRSPRAWRSLAGRSPAAQRRCRRCWKLGGASAARRSRRRRSPRAWRSLAGRSPAAQCRCRRCWKLGAASAAQTIPAAPFAARPALASGPVAGGATPLPQLPPLEARRGERRATIAPSAPFARAWRLALPADCRRRNAAAAAAGSSAGRARRDDLGGAVRRAPGAR